MGVGAVRKPQNAGKQTQKVSTPRTALQSLEEANIKRATGGRVTARQIANYFDDTLLQTGKYPSIPDAMREFGVSRPTVKRALKNANISLLEGGLSLQNKWVSR